MSILKTLLPSPVLYIRLYQNKLEVKHLQSGKSTTVDAVKPFSNGRLLISDSFYAQETFDKVKNEIFGNKVLRPSYKIVIQVADPNIPEISPVERMIYNDFGAEGGASHVYIVEHQNYLSDEEVKQLSKLKNYP